MRKIFSLLAVLFVACAFAACDEEGGPGEQGPDASLAGKLNEMCKPDSLCDEGLACNVISNVCEKADGGAGGTLPPIGIDPDAGKLGKICKPEGLCNEGLACNSNANVCVEYVNPIPGVNGSDVVVVIPPVEGVSGTPGGGEGVEDVTVAGEPAESLEWKPSITPGLSSLIYAGTSDGLYFSWDFGVNWVKMYNYFDIVMDGQAPKIKIMKDPQGVAINDIVYFNAAKGIGSDGLVAATNRGIFGIGIDANMGIPTGAVRFMGEHGNFNTLKMCFGKFFAGGDQGIFELGEVALTKWEKVKETGIKSMSCREDGKILIYSNSNQVCYIKGENDPICYPAPKSETINFVLTGETAGLYFGNFGTDKGFYGIEQQGISSPMIGLSANILSAIMDNQTLMFGTDKGLYSTTQDPAKPLFGPWKDSPANIDRFVSVKYSYNKDKDGKKYIILAKEMYFTSKSGLYFFMGGEWQKFEALPVSDVRGVAVKVLRPKPIAPKKIELLPK